MSVETFSGLGYALVPGVIAREECLATIRHVQQLQLVGAGSRNLLALDWCRAMVLALKRNSSLRLLFPPHAVAVQCTLFEKTTEKNWGVAPHQDLSIPVRERVSAKGCVGWSQKEGVNYTQPPPEVLAELVAVRVHLDPCPLKAGPLRVVPGSHRSGRLAAAEIIHCLAEHDEVACIADGGDALVMRPLILHASSRATGNDPRRVLHFLFGPRELPHGLNWHQAV